MGQVFSVEMKSKAHVRSISISNEAYDRVLFEGDLGNLMMVLMIDGTVLEVVGTNGVLRLGIDEDVLQKVLTSPDRELKLTSNGIKNIEESYVK